MVNKDKRMDRSPYRDPSRKVGEYALGSRDRPRSMHRAVAGARGKVECGPPLARACAARSEWASSKLRVVKSSESEALSPEAFSVDAQVARSSLPWPRALR